MASKTSRLYRVWLFGGAVVGLLGIVMAILLAASPSTEGSAGGMVAAACLFAGGAIVSALGYVGLSRSRKREREGGA
ncbi:uncharacterized membrane protein HdeD (DUF308 family) [Microbacterium halimionae]|uniref:Uncharacterized membrane protein HdeD (DUF308 family) n=1 Tax=Microbacterium halimionae TaxID=1526413 RepID=A0A7W3JNP2_9MICO|nr:uncharacterized membrane protein HdeD (DUF308 family) [Microbacterium halimionae]NII96372.1 uncharacterized membrane protein HdeD (DUF308 family) [Microbacterium halimionae]